MLNFHYSSRELLKKSNNLLNFSDLIFFSKKKFPHCAAPFAFRFILLLFLDFFNFQFNAKTNLLQAKTNDEFDGTVPHFYHRAWGRIGATQKKLLHACPSFEFLTDIVVSVFVVVFHLNSLAPTAVLLQDVSFCYCFC